MLSLRIDANAQQLAFLPKLEQRFLQRQQQSQQAKQRQTAKRQQDSLVTQFIELSQLSVTGLVISQINWLADELTISGLYQNTEAVKHLVDWLRRQQSNRQIDVSFPRAGQFLLLASDDRE